MERKAYLTALRAVRTKCFVKRNRMALMTAAMPGAMTQVAKTRETPVHPQLILVQPTEATPEPTRPPTMEWVVLTGRP